MPGDRGAQLYFCQWIMKPGVLIVFTVKIYYMRSTFYSG